MNRFFSVFFATVSALVLNSCAIAPLTHDTPARPLGKSNLETTLQWSGYTNSSDHYVLFPAGRVRYGLSDRLTLSTISETKSLRVDGLYTYYISEQNRYFLAAGVSSTFIGQGISYGLYHTASFLVGQWEPFFSFEIYRANLEPGSIDMSLFSTPPDLHGILFRMGIGTRYWITTGFSLGLHGNVLISSGSIKFYTPFLQTVSANLVW